ncbi:hypothetical protein pb186bvf_006561 [Paramecium bursaria]
MQIHYTIIYPKLVHSSKRIAYRHLMPNEIQFQKDINQY